MMTPDDARRIAREVLDEFNDNGRPNYVNEAELIADALYAAMQPQSDLATNPAGGADDAGVPRPLARGLLRDAANSRPRRERQQPSSAHSPAVEQQANIFLGCWVRAGADMAQVHADFDALIAAVRAEAQGQHEAMRSYLEGGLVPIGQLPEWFIQGLAKHADAQNANAMVAVDENTRANNLQAQLSAKDAEIETLKQARDEYKTLASVGTWHHDCRPNRQMAARELIKSQAVIDKLADTISALNARAESAEAELLRRETLRDGVLLQAQGRAAKAEAERDALKAKLEALRPDQSATDYLDSIEVQARREERASVIAEVTALIEQLHREHPGGFNVSELKAQLSALADPQEPHP